MERSLSSYTVVIPVLNQLHYTRQCLESLTESGTSKDAILVINNASTDGTGEWLEHNGYRHIDNTVNLDCGGAWTQGALAEDTEWLFFLNNDVVVCKDFCQRLIDSAVQHKLDLVCPAMVEGELDYDFEEFSAKAVTSLRGIVRKGAVNGVCILVRKSLFYEVGFFDTDKLLGGHEDSEFIIRIKRQGFKAGTTGDAFLHHFGSVTQKAMALEAGVSKHGDHRYFYRKMGMGWFARKMYRRAKRRLLRKCATAELKARGLTLHMERREGAWVYL
ncbi:MAG: glycosyltransferase [Candidatus Protistobacter heckmanni]|nr:glycosyltransferase [Candidatus Protistobacter heckmanni]